MGGECVGIDHLVGSIAEIVALSVMVVLSWRTNRPVFSGFVPLTTLSCKLRAADDMLQLTQQGCQVSERLCEMVGDRLSLPLSCINNMAKIR